MVLSCNHFPYLILGKYPENSERLKNRVRVLKRECIDELVQADRDGGKELCSGTLLNSGSWDAAFLAAGIALSAKMHILMSMAKLHRHWSDLLIIRLNPIKLMDIAS